MANYREVHSLSLVDAAYLAGLVDGEGTITLSRKHANDGRQLVISISSTERQILDFAHGAIGAGKSRRRKPRRRITAHPSRTRSGTGRHSTCSCKSSPSYAPTNVSARLSCANTICDSRPAMASTSQSSWLRGSNSRMTCCRYARIARDS